MKFETYFQRLLTRTGDWYVIIAIFLTQLSASIGTVLGVIFEQLNADYSPELIREINRVQGIGIPFAILALFGTALFLSRRIRGRLKIWKDTPELLDKTENLEAWQDSSFQLLIIFLLP